MSDTTLREVIFKQANRPRAAVLEEIRTAASVREIVTALAAAVEDGTISEAEVLEVLQEAVALEADGLPASESLDGTDAAGELKGLQSSDGTGSGGR